MNEKLFRSIAVLREDAIRRGMTHLAWHYQQSLLRMIHDRIAEQLMGRS